MYGIYTNLRKISTYIIPLEIKKTVKVTICLDRTILIYMDMNLTTSVAAMGKGDINTSSYYGTSLISNFGRCS